MAKFYKATQSNDVTVFINIDAITSMHYDENEDKTYVFDGTDMPFELKGEHIGKILNVNNDVSMRDKNSTNYMVDKLKMSLSLILSRLDALLKETKKN